MAQWIVEVLQPVGWVRAAGPVPFKEANWLLRNARRSGFMARKRKVEEAEKEDSGNG